MSNEIILAMREPHLSRLLSGEKTAEVRRTRPSLKTMDGIKPLVLYLYHRGAIHGICFVKNVRFRRDGILDERGLKSWVSCHHKQACLTEAEMTNYLNGAKFPCIYFIINAFPYEAPITVSCRPQSWMYMTPEVRSVLLQKGGAV